jgi:hypothetical protein
MTLGTDRRDRLRILANRVRAIPGQQYGLRPYTVSLVTTVWSGANTGEGSPAPDTIDIVEANGQPPKVRLVKSDEIALGNLANGTIDIGPITPELGARIADLNAVALPTGGTRVLLVTGPDGVAVKHKILSINTDHALHYTIRSSPVAT